MKPFYNIKISILLFKQTERPTFTKELRVIDYFDEKLCLNSLFCTGEQTVSTSAIPVYAFVRPTSGDFKDLVYCLFYPVNGSTFNTSAFNTATILGAYRLLPELKAIDHSSGTLSILFVYILLQCMKQQLDLVPKSLLLVNMTDCKNEL